MGLEQRDTKVYLSILADGSIRRSVPEGTEGAVKRTYETKDGKKGEKWELVYGSLSGYISGIEIFEGDYGKLINLTIEDKDEFTLAVNTSSNFGEDLMKKLPNVNFAKEIQLKPYSFEDEKGKTRKGITIKQNGEKVINYFWNDADKHSINGYPKPDGNLDTFDSDDWKAFYITARKFLMNYTIENLVPKIVTKENRTAPIEQPEPPQEETVEYPEEEQNPEEIPF